MRAAGLDAPPAGAAWRLATARTLAWALLFGGWIVLGTLGRQHLPTWAAGQAPVALWLVTLGATLVGSARRPPTPRALRTVLAGAGLGLAVALAAIGRGGAGAAVMSAAVCWGVLLVAVSLAVRSLRFAQPGLPPAPLLPAATGAGVAWLGTGELPGLHERLDAIGLALAVAALAVALLLAARATGRAPGGCRAALFDCSLALPSLSAWRRSGDWPLHAAALAMLPMMAALPAMVDWCAVSPPWFGAATAWHLAAMVLPAVTLRAWLQRVARRRLNGVVAVLLLAGGLALLGWPGLYGLMLAAVLHALAWSLAWAAPMVSRERAPRAAAQPARLQGLAPLGAALSMAAAVLALGIAIDRFGPQALMAVHAALAVVGSAGLLMMSATSRRAAMVETTEAPS